MCRRKRHYRDRDRCSVHINRRAERDRYRVGILIKSHLRTGFHVDRDIRSRASREECSDRTLFQALEDQRERILADAPEYKNRVRHKVDKEHRADKHREQLSILGEC